ncbi:unnamed protein product [Oikopleura dioica]|uniref:Major facilitator superfamily (MFS) profile domain-containing protein n=1 Tax=Oikopleura dioica TaxID=34765 RepID=E4YRY7_OIKDI|nr:unnamed protein product [Oikopleura dioica]
MFIFAQILHGFGCTPLYTIGFSYVEDSTTAENAAGSCLGPAIGYVFGAAQLTVWVDAPAVVPDIDNTNPQWVGAWWIGMLACGIGSILCSLPMFGFPKQFPGVAEIKAQKKSESIEATDLGEDASLFQGVKSLLWNPVFLWASLGSALDGYLSSTLMTFGPKMYEIWFRRTAGQAALEAGIACVPGAMLGSFIGGVIVKVFKLNGRQMMYASSLCAVMVFGFYTAARENEYFVIFDVFYSE